MMLKEFRTFISRGNVLDLAVAVIIGAAFGRIVSSLTDDVIMPVVGRLTGNLDFSSHFVLLGPVPADYRGSLASYADLKKAGATMVGYGAFLTQIVNFLIVAFVIFLILRGMNRAVAALEREKATRPVPPADSAEVILLREIRDELRGRSAGADAHAETLPLDGQ